MRNPDPKEYPDTLMPTLCYDDAGRFLEFKTHVEEGIAVIQGLCRQNGIAARSDVRPAPPNAMSTSEATKQRNIVLLNGFCHSYASLKNKEEKIAGLKFTGLMSDVLTSSPMSHVPKNDILASPDQFKWGQGDLEFFWWQLRPGNVAGVVALCQASTAPYSNFASV